MSRLESQFRHLALTEYERQRKRWSPRASYWITVYKYGTPVNRLCAAFMLGAMQIFPEDFR